MADEKKTDDSKTLKKLLEAHVMVAQSKLGRVPTLDEINKMLSEAAEQEKVAGAAAEQPEDPNEPKILHMQAYCGMSGKDKDKKPDPNKVLFYEGKDGRVYDTTAQVWMPSRPSTLDHLHSRPLTYDAKGQDVLRAIAHGVIDDEDFAELDKMGAINDDSKRVYSLHKRASELHGQLSALEKSEEAEIEVDEGVGTEETAPLSEGSNVLATFFDVAGVQQGLEQIEREFGQQGVDVFKQIIAAALASVDDKTRMLVREEIETHMGPVVEAIEALARHVGLNVDVNSEHEPGADETDELTVVPVDASIESDQ